MSAVRSFDLLKIVMTLQLGLRSLMLHKLRSFLTMLGTVLGVASVISMLAIGEGSKRESIEQIRQLGTTNVILRTVKPLRQVAPPPSDDGSETQSNQQQAQVFEYGLTRRDYDRLTSTLPNIVASVPITLLRKEAQNGRRRIPNARILGTTSQLVDVKRLAVRYGRFLSPADSGKTANVAVLGAGAARQLFGYEYPLGKTVLLGDGAYRVVGVLRRQSSGNVTPGAVGQDDFNNDIYVPLTAAQRRIGETQQIGSLEFELVELNEVTLTVSDERHVESTAEMARILLEQTHTQQKDFEIQVPLELLEKAQRERQIWNLVLGSIAGISLVVGGIGIMNIMLATVTERTREIGIRRALGARRSDITLQFLVESTTLSSIGGLIGIAVGVCIPIAISIASDIQTALTIGPVLFAFIVSVATGVIFGVYPASRAAAMDPIEALRHE